MARSCGNRRLSILAGIMALIGFMGAAHGNDRGLRGTMIVPSGCQIYPVDIPNCNSPLNQRGKFTGNGWIGGICSLVLTCPLPINNIDLGGTSSDNDISKFRVHYKNSNVTGQVIVHLIRSQVVSTGFTSSAVCGGALPRTGNIPTRTTVQCPHDVAGDGTFYHFEVILQSPISIILGDSLMFLGIDFPA